MNIYLRINMLLFLVFSFSISVLAQQPEKKAMTRKEAINLQYNILSNTQDIEKMDELCDVTTEKYKARRLAWSNLMDLYNYSDSTYLSAEALFDEARIHNDSIGIVAAYKTLFNSPDTLVIEKYRVKIDSVLSKSELRLGLKTFMDIKKNILAFGYDHKKRDNTGLYQAILIHEKTELQTATMKTEEDMDWMGLRDKYNAIYFYMTVLIANRNVISPSSFYYEYVNKLDSITQTLPEQNVFLRSQALNSINFVREGNQNYKALKVTLAESNTITREMEEGYKSSGRIYKDYGVVYFQNTVSYINCFTELSTAEVDSCYNLIQEGLQKYAILRRYFGSLKDFSYEKAYKHKEYDKCLAYAREILDTKKTKIWSINIDILLDQCISISKKKNNRNDLLFYMNKKLGRIAVIEKRFYTEQKAESNMIQQVFDTQHRNVQLLKDEFLAKKKISTLITSAVIGVGCFLLVIVVILLRNLNLEHQKVHMMRHREEALKLAKDAAIKSAKLQVDFLHNINHEIRTPLNSIIGFSNIISDDPDLSNEERDDYKQRIDQSSKELVKLIDDVLELSNLKNGDVLISLEPINLNEMIGSIYESFVEMMKDNVKLQFYSGVDDTFQMLLNPERIRQVLGILLNNAIKYTTEGTIQIRIESEQEMQCRIVVEDTGCGVHSQLVPNLFNYLQKEDEFERGIGIGLNIAHAIIEIMGGELSYDISYTSGARFVITL